MGPIQYNKFLPKLCATPSKRKIKFKMEFRFFFILSLGLMANGLPTKTKTGAELRASDYFDTTNLRSGDQSANPNVTFPVRLIHGASGIVGGKSGRLEVHISGQWGAVCDDYFPNGDPFGNQPNNNVALVVCRMLGFAGGQVVTHAQEIKFGKFDKDPILVKNVHCQGNEVDLSHCQMTRTAVHTNCGHDEDLGIICD